jgi:hypothetical protein
MLRRSEPTPKICDTVRLIGMVPRWINSVRRENVAGTHWGHKTRLWPCLFQFDGFDERGQRRTSRAILQRLGSPSQLLTLAKASDVFAPYLATGYGDWSDGLTLVVGDSLDDRNARLFVRSRRSYLEGYQPLIRIAPRHPCVDDHMSFGCALR